MGYHTDFTGDFRVTPVLKPEHKEYLTAFANTRRVKRDEDKAALLPDPIRVAAGLPVGFEGAYFVGGDGYKGQGNDDSVIDGNSPPGSPKVPYAIQKYDPATFQQHWQTEQELKRKALELGLAQPGLWCQWVPNHDGSAIEWDGGEKFYEYIEWIEYLTAHFLGPWGYTLNGEVQWQGEESEDMGLIRIVYNEVHVLRAHITWR